MLGLTAAQAARLNPELVAEIADWTNHPERHDAEDLLRRVTDRLQVTQLDDHRPTPAGHVRPADVRAGMWIRDDGQWRRIEAVRERFTVNSGRVFVQFTGRPQLGALVGDTPIPYSELPVGHNRADTILAGATIWCDDCAAWEQVVAVNASCEGRQMHTATCVVVAWPWEPVAFQIADRSQRHA